MAIYKNNNGTWYVMIRYQDWTGARKQKCKRGFEWIGEYDISADELLNGDGKGQKSRKAKEFLLEILADGGKEWTPGFH